MDAKHRTEAGIPQAEMPTIRLDEGKVRRTNGWLLGAVVALAVAVVALGAALVVEVNSEETPTAATLPPATGLADPAGVTFVDGFLAAHNTNDADTIEGQFAPDAVFTSVPSDGTVEASEGRDAIWGFYSGLFDAVPDLRVERVSPIFQSGEMFAFTVRDSNQTEMLWVLVQRDGKVAEQWNIFLED